MGLAGTKNKRKWAKDPNNTIWSRNTDTFGHKIMRSQGWAPGEYLGAKDASHSKYYSAANASHIRAVMKDDNMGLGARRNQGDECTGMDALQDLLSRLNGKSDEAMGEEKRRREDTKINKYLHRKLGTVRFVYGGLLVGDKVQELADSLKEKEQGAAKVPGQDGAHEEGVADAKEKKSKKRKAEDGEGVTREQKKAKKSKKRKADEAEDDGSKAKRKDKKDKKKRKEEEATRDGSATESEGEEESRPDDADEAASAHKKSKKEKEKRRKSKENTDDDDEKSADASDSQSRKKKKKRKAGGEDGGEASQPPTKPSTPAVGGISTPISTPVPHRHLARSRFIAQKRAAVMDQAALNQIFMIKA